MADLFIQDAPPPLKDCLPPVKGKSVRFPLLTVSLVRDSSTPAEGLQKSEAIDTPARAVDILFPLIGGKDREHFVAILLDARSRVLGVNVVSVGTLSASLVHPREVFKAAILAGAAAIVVSHNHPSGEAVPSAEDRDATRRLQRAGEILGIPLLDHVIIGNDKTAFYSFKEGGLL